jgi:release factor glutamine methyltransferase
VVQPHPVPPLHSTLTHAAARLAAAGIESPRWDAEQLAAHVLGTTRSRLSLAAAMTHEQASAFDALLDRRAARVPLQHLTGSVGFRFIDLEVGPGVFVPRPETEVVAGWAVTALRDHPAPVVVDLCSGSGAIALSLAHELPRAEVHAVELDADALAWARKNADRRAAAGDRPVTLHHSDVTSAVPELDGRVDLVISNPPYVAPDELAAVDPEVREHDPHVALVGGSDGLDVVRAVSRTAARLLRPGGLLVVEHSDRQGASVPALLSADGWQDVADHPDLTGRDRFATARHPEEPAP